MWLWRPLWVVVWKHPLVERVRDKVIGGVGIVVGGELGVEQGEDSLLFLCCHILEGRHHLVG